MALLHANDNNFDKIVLSSEKKVLVDFFANWCGPCKMIAPTLEKISLDHPEIDVVKVNVDEAMRVSMTYQVEAIPTLVVFENGKIISRKLGFMSENDILDMLK